MARYIPEYSFVATIKSVHPDYAAVFDFSKITCDRFICMAHDSGHHTDSRQHLYLSLTTQPMGEDKFWFLYHQWDDGSTSYEIKVHNLQENRSPLRSLMVDARDYIVPYPFGSWSQGWRITWDDQCSCPPRKKKPGKALYEVEPEELTLGELGPVRLRSPNERDLQVYKRKNFGSDWWAYVTDKDGYKIPLSINILELGIRHPLHE
jgi:hypothetical protein